MGLSDEGQGSGKNGLLKRPYPNPLTGCLAVSLSHCLLTHSLLLRFDLLALPANLGLNRCAGTQASVRRGALGCRWRGCQVAVMNLLVAGWPLSVAGGGGRQDNRGMGERESGGVSAGDLHSRFDERDWGVSAVCLDNQWQLINWGEEEQEEMERGADGGAGKLKV